MFSCVAVGVMGKGTAMSQEVPFLVGIMVLLVIVIFVLTDIRDLLEAL